MKLPYDMRNVYTPALRLVAMRYLLVLAMLSCLPALNATAYADDASPAATQPAGESAEAQAAAPAAELDPELNTWLDRIEARAATLESLRGKLRYEKIQGLLGDKQIRFGELSYDAGPPARFAVRFDRLVVDGRLRGQSRAYIFDGHWLAEQQDDEKVFIRRQLVADDETSEDLLKLGEGPFALPLDLKKQTLLQRFNVKLIESTKDDPDDTVHLQLTPKAHVDIDQSQIDIWYGERSLLPVQVHSINKAADEEAIIRLRELQTAAAFSNASFDTTPPSAPGWQVEIKPLEDNTPATPAPDAED